MQKYALAALLSTSVLAADVDFTKKSLDDMAVYFSGKGAKYDQDYYKQLQSCMVKDGDDILVPSQDAAWRGMVKYFQSNGTDHDYMNQTDHWGGCTPETPNTRCPVGDYKDRKIGLFGEEQMVIYEDCNYVSNVAYYRSATRICDYPDWAVDSEQQKGLKRSFTTLAMGSAMWHGSHTYVGYSFDNNMIAVISYLAHQSSVSGLGSSSSVLNELSPTPRTKTGLQVSEDLVTMFSEKPVDQWAQVLDTADLPHVYFITFAALISTCFSLVMPWFLVQWSINLLANALIPKEDAEFVVNSYLPELKTAVANVSIPMSEKKDVVNKFFGMIMKIGFAFLWQEFFIPLPALYHSIPNQFGAFIMPYWNEISTKISGFAQTDKNVADSKNVYPGDDKCRGSSPHALWHEESANGLLEIVFLADYVAGLFHKSLNGEFDQQLEQEMMMQM